MCWNHSATGNGIKECRYKSCDTPETPRDHYNQMGDGINMATGKMVNVCK